MKNLKSLLLFLIFPFFGFAQSLNGIYTGVLSNDSTTVRRDQSFEMALTEYKDKVYGYAYSTFIVNDTLYFIVKRVKGTVTGDICEVEDDEVISHNFPQKPEKKVFVTYTLRRSSTDSVWRLDGDWKTNLTKKYYAISGKVETKEEKDLSKSKLFDHLGDLNLQQTLAFAKPKKPATENKPAKVKDAKADVAKNKKQPEKKTDQVVAKTETKLPDNKNNPAVVNPQAQQVVTPTKTEEKKDVAVSEQKQPEKKTELVVVKTETKIPDNKINPAVVNPQAQQVVTPPKAEEKKDVVVSEQKQPEKKTEQVVAKTETKIPDNKISPTVVNPQAQQEVTPPKTDEKKDVVVNEQKQPEKKTETKIPDNKINPAVVNPQAKQEVTPPKTEEKKDVAVSEQKQPEKKTEQVVVKTETKIPDNKNNPVVVNPQAKQEVTPPKTDEKKDVVVNRPAQQVNTQPKTDEKKIVSAPQQKQPEKKPEPVVAKTDTKISDNKNNPVAVNQPAQQVNTQPKAEEKNNIAVAEQKQAEKKSEFEFTELSRKRKLKPAAALVDGRESKPSEIIFFKADSLIISLYDNGEVDGDTVSVIINDEIFIDKQVLKSVAFRKTFYVPLEESDSLLVVLYADNLGKYPPNTGLLQIKDGEEIYYVRFKADLDRNAALVLRRKYK
jgi:hypothetical protein